MLESEFTDIDRDRKLLSKFDRLAQIKDVYTYVSAFRQVCLELGDLVTDDQKLFRFIQGLKPEVQQHVLLQTDVTTLSEAILLAERVQQAQDFQKYGTLRKQPNRAPRDNTVPMELGNTNAQSRSFNNKGKQQMHKRGNNAKGNKVNYMHNKQNNRPSTSRTPFTCHYCGKPNHYARDCYSRKRDMQMHHTMQQPPPPPPPPKN